MEVIAAIAVFTTLAVAVLGASAQMMQAYSSIQTSLDDSQEVSVIDSSIRSAVQSVNFPYWYSSLPVIDDSDLRFIIGHVDGEKNRALKLEYDDEVFSVSTGVWEDDSFNEEQKQQFKGITSFSWELLTDQWRGTHGLLIKLGRGDEKEEIICREEFGSFFIKEKESL